MKTFIGFKQALDLTLSRVPLCETEVLPLDRLTGRVLAEDIIAGVDSPSLSTSRKEGYAVISEDVAAADGTHPVELAVVGRLTAGDRSDLSIHRGQAVRVTTGAPLPRGASAVLSEEFCRRSADKIVAGNTSRPGRNILARGTDIRKGQTLAVRGEKLTPPLIGLIAAGGAAAAAVYKVPAVAVIATGDEVVVPGKPLPEGGLYASNMVQLGAWLNRHSFPYTVDLVADSRAAIEAAISRRLGAADAFITSGGAWGSERDLILEVTEKMGWQGVYHRVRMGPGKPVGFGLLEKRPFFVLPGGPPSNEMAFLQLALPALMKMKGDRPTIFPVVCARLSEAVRGHVDWTEFIHARVEKTDKELLVHPAKLKSRLQSMVRKQALIIIPEGRRELTAGQTIAIQLMAPVGAICNFSKLSES